MQQLRFLFAMALLYGHIQHMYSWWWVRLLPETCRVKLLRRKKRNCCILLDLFHYYKAWCSEPHILNSGMGGSRSFQLTTTVTKLSSTVPRRQMNVSTCLVNVLLNKIHWNLLLTTDSGFCNFVIGCLTTVIKNRIKLFLLDGWSRYWYLKTMWKIFMFC